METIRGRKSLELDLKEWNVRLANYKHIMLDLGTGDGRYARSLAQAHPDWFIIGVDACRENLREHSQAKLQNLLFIIAQAQELPRELEGLASQVTINFPWGSLLQSLLTGDPKLMHGLHSVSCARASLSLRLNAGALAEVGKTLESGADRVYYNLLQVGWHLHHPDMIGASALQKLPSTWAKRLAFGRDPRAMVLSGRK
ncbi:MAG TPA: class I SAM-dependent methyltransferase [Anaerolineales bacterium]|nr:class I SAM-dependent methyltransferase [Anaerolineales bacterium]